MAMVPAFSCKKMIVGCFFLSLAVHPFGVMYQAYSLVPSAAWKLTTCRGAFGTRRCCLHQAAMCCAVYISSVRICSEAEAHSGTGLAH